MKTELRTPARDLQRLYAEQPQAWVVAEKILDPAEGLPEEWPIAGTTGYDFMNQVGGLLVDRRAEEVFTRIYREFSGQHETFRELVTDCKRRTCREVLGSDLNWLTGLFARVIHRHRRHRDFTTSKLRRMLQEVAVCLPVYRTYVNADLDAQTGEESVSDQDVHTIEQAIACAKENLLEVDPLLFDFFGDLLLLRIRGDVEGELVMRFQQFTGPVMAKGVEDTAFYTDNRLVSLDEVGCALGIFGCSSAEFHNTCIAVQARWPRRMLVTSTHDARRSEDVRTRLHVLTEMPDAWEAAVQRWSQQNARCRTGAYPAANDEYLIYQTLVGAWPLSRERLSGYMEKACEEAKLFTSWTAPYAGYEQAVQAFIDGIYANREYLADVETFVGQVRDPGWINSLAQTLIKLTAPGVPDIYQGTELWDYSLVDPDNRRKVDFGLRRELLAELRIGSEELTPEEIWKRREQGLPKLWLIVKTLDFRRRPPKPFSPDGDYLPLTVRGEHAIAYLRGGRVMVVAPRLPASAGSDWGDTQGSLPEGRWMNELTGEVVQGGWARLADLLRRFPAGLFSLAAAQ